MSSPSAFVACKVKVNLTIFSTSFSKKRLFRDISCNFLIRVLIPIVSLSFSSNKLHNVHFFHFLLGVKGRGVKGEPPTKFSKGDGGLDSISVFRGVV